MKLLSFLLVFFFIFKSNAQSNIEQYKSIISRTNKEVFVKKYNTQFLEDPSYFIDYDLTYSPEDYKENEDNLKYFKLVTRSLRLESNSYPYCDTFDILYNLYYTIKKYDSLLSQTYDATKVEKAISDLSILPRLNNNAAKLNLHLDRLKDSLVMLQSQNQTKSPIAVDTLSAKIEKDLDSSSLISTKKSKSKSRKTKVENSTTIQSESTQPKKGPINLESQYKSLISEINRDVFFKRYKKFLLDSPAYFTQKDISLNSDESLKIEENLNYLDLVTTSMRVDSQTCIYCDKFSTLYKLYHAAKLFSPLLSQKYNASSINPALNELKSLKKLNETNAKLNLRCDQLLNYLSNYLKYNELTKKALEEIKVIPIYFKKSSPEERIKFSNKFKEKSTLDIEDIRPYSYLYGLVEQFFKSNKNSFSPEDF